MFVNCYGDWAPVKGTIVDVRDIVTPTMHYDVMLHLVSVYIGLSCASLSVVLVIEAEHSYSQILNEIQFSFFYFSVLSCPLSDWGNP